jgi:hypothetical protein
MSTGEKEETDQPEFLCKDSNIFLNPQKLSTETI